jgi:Kef-type K+ transport system membrane component KefB
MSKHRNYWFYSIACFLVWAVLLAVVALKGNKETTHNFVLVFSGWAIAWVSTTIARYVYPPPKRWLNPGTETP